ncbi:MAG: hypothetical protein NT004_12780 [Bacteroidetes bacterium]|nr:hypothetical protein [Bacteroidota bacterium]
MENENTAEEPVVPYNQPLDFQQVWRMFQETDKKFQETDRQLKETDRILTEKFYETDRLLTEKFQETDKQFKETDKQFKETDKQFKETDKQFKETDKQFKETDRQFKETDKKIRKLDQLFTSQWGKLVESLVEGDLIKLLKEKGIGVERTLRRSKGNHKGQNFEYDIIAINGAEIVIVEVKTTLRPDDVDDFHEKLWKAKTYMPEYHDKIVYGAMAFITADGSTDRMAEKQGFFVIRATGNSASILNEPGFKPKPF